MSTRSGIFIRFVIQGADTAPRTATSTRFISVLPPRRVQISTFVSADRIGAWSVLLLMLPLVAVVCRGPVDQRFVARGSWPLPGRSLCRAGTGVTPETTKHGAGAALTECRAITGKPVMRKPAH